MKKLTLILSTILTFSLFSCTSDDKNEENMDFKNLLIGEWQSETDPGYGDPTFYNNGRVSFNYHNEASDDDFLESGSWILTGKNLKITWDESDSGLKVYYTKIIELTKSKLIWEVVIDGESTEESYSKQ